MKGTSQIRVEMHCKASSGSEFPARSSSGVVEENGQERGSNEVGICRDRWRPWLMDVSGQNVRLDQPHCEAKPDQFPIP